MHREFEHAHTFDWDFELVAFLCQETKTSVITTNTEYSITLWLI